MEKTTERAAAVVVVVDVRMYVLVDEIDHISMGLGQSVGGGRSMHISFLSDFVNTFSLDRRQTTVS